MKRLLLSLLFLVQLLFTPSVFAESIKINEFYSDGSSDWVEVYNDGADLNLYRLRDSSTNNKKDLSEATCNGNFCTIDWDDNLNNGGDTIRLVLISAPDTSLDEISYGDSGTVAAPTSGQSAGRNPDGTGNWTIFLTASKGASNNNSPTPSATPTSTPTLTPTSTPTPTPTDTPTPTKTPTPTLTPTPKPPSKTPTKAPTKTPTLKNDSSDNSQVNIPSSLLATNSAEEYYPTVLGKSTSVTPTPENTSGSKLNPFLILGGGILIIVGINILVYFYKNR